MTRAATLSLALTVLVPSAARACAVAEGCPVGEPFDACAAVRVDHRHLCVNDPAAPGGFVIVPRDVAVPPNVSDCGGEACRHQSPADVGQRLGAALARLLGLG